ncbi:MAG: amino acid adenylation domain-containing protein, partial [Acidobacteriota bacterium]
DLATAELRRRIVGRGRIENELVIDPAFFAALAQELPRLGRVEIHPKRGQAHNELTGFRYQVVLRVGEAVPPPEIPWLDWRDDGLTLDALHQRLAAAAETTDPLGLQAIPNARVARAAAATHLLASDEAPATAGQLRQAVASDPTVATAVDPQALCDLATQMGFEIELGWADPRADGRLSAVLRSQEGDPTIPISAWLPMPTADPQASVATFANQPTQAPAARLETDELRAFLGQRLPEYMVPASFVFLDRLPLTQNGKIDRTALARLETAPTGAETFDGNGQPRTPLEEQLAAIWADVLGRQRVGIHDDFLALGGHSLRATQVVSRIRSQLRAEITIRQVMEVTTVAELARLLTTLQASDPSTVEPDLVPRSDIDTPPPASFAQQRLWFLERWLPGNLAYSVPLVLRFSGHLRVAALVPALGEIARRHEALRTTFQDSEAGPIQVIAPPSSALDRLPMVDLSALGDAGRTEAEALLQREARRPFDLARGPLWRKLLLRLDPTRHLLLCNLHHIVFDGWSQGIFFRELAALYDAAVLGKTAVLAHLPVQPADFAKWQQAWLQGDTLEAELSYWRDRLAGASGLLRLPTDRPRPAVQRYRGAIRTFEVPAALKSRLEDLAGQRGGTLFMVAMAGFMALMARLTGQRDLIIATGVANRSRQVIEPLIGFFVNTLPLRAELFNDPSFNAIVDATRREALAAFAHQDVPFAKLIEALRPERDLSVAPLVQALLVLQTAPMEPVQPTDLELDYRLLPIGASRFDFGLELTASGDGLIGSVEYNTDLFEATTIDRWLAHFVELLDGAVDEPRRSLSQLPLLSAAQRQQLRTEWHDDAWVVDAWGQTAPIGVVGQLHPASEAADASARTRHDGALEHLARDDARVESGGFRLADRLPRRQHDGAGATATPLEEQLAGIWRQLLALDEVGPDDDFFHLGGHSLLATRLISRLRTTLGIELPVTALFEHPTVATLARRIEALLAEQAMTARPELPPLRPRPTSEHDLVPPSFAQERLWFLYQWQPESPIYNVPMLLSLRGPLAVGALQAALQAIERRHEALRTVFAAADQPLAQRIRPWTPRPLPQIDLTHLRPADAAEATRRHLRHAARRPFNLEQGPLWRRWLVRSGAESYALFSGFHHIVFDGWSTGILCHELEALYAAFSAGRAPALPEPAVQYADFALWQRAWLDESRQTQEIDYWRQRLAGAPDLLELPTDRPRGPQDQARGDWLALRLPAPLHSALVELSRRQGVTLFMTLLAAFDVLLARLSAQRDVVIGTPIANRTDEATESMIGFFVNTLVLRNEVGTDSTFDQLLRQIRHTTLEAYAHQQLPFEKLVEALQPTRNLHHTPLFQVSLGLQNATSFQPRLAGLEVELSAHDLGVAKYDFSLLLEEGGLFDPRSAASTAEVTATGASGIAEYRSDLFDATTIRRWLDHLAQILTVAVHDPSTPVDDLPLLEPAAQRQLVSEWNDSAVQYPEAEVAAHRMFERQARIRPEAVAVQSGDEHLTYEALRCQSHRLARQLAQHGVGIEDRVGLCLECVPERIIAVLAVLEAGGVYVPIEPGLPAERRRVLLEDSGAVCWLSAESTPAEASIRWVDPTTLQANETHSTETESAGPIDRAALARRSAASPEQLAYVLYTSGSTGLPKGVMISHGTLSNLLCWAIDALGLTPRDRTLHRIPIGFDPSVFEMLLPLASGGRLVLGGPDSAHDAAVVVREIAERRIDTLILVPTMASLILQDPEVARAAGLRRMFCGGETLTLELAERFATSPLKGIELINGYGPTEACVLMTCERLRPESLAGEPQHPAVTPHGSLAIGRPLANTKAYGFDPRLRPSPVGVPGELFIGGVCLARGYLADPRKTAAAFVPNAHGDEPGGRLYRSGDLVRSLPDGRWVFLRRRDLQIKLRGQRIEPGEIEAALIAHPAIGNAVITVHSPTSEDTTDRSDPADRLLVAWLEGTSDDPPPTETLRRDLLDSLPAYMVPALFQWLEALPLNSSGKVDRGALERRPVTLEPEDREEASTAPRTPTEEILLGIWSDVLQRSKPKRDTPQRDTLGPNDNFFDLGGHSLLATRVTSRASAVFDTDLGPRDLFENPTVGLLAEAIDRGLRSGPDSAAPSLPLEPVDRATPLPLSFAQARLWFLDQLAPGSLTYNSTFPLGLEGQLDVAHLQRAFQELVARHEVLRTTFALAGDEPVQVITPPAEHPMPWVDLAHLEPSDRARQVERLTFEDEQRPFDLVRGPLVRTLLLRQADDQHALLLSIHHIVFDGWSLPILLSEVAAFYRTGLDPASTKPLTALPVQYADYAAWQRQRLSGDALQAELDYWRQALSSTMPPARMALDIPRAQAEPSRVGHARRRTSADTATALVELGRHEGATLFMTLLAVYQTLLRRSTGAETVIVGTPVANRHPLAIE